MGAGHFLVVKQINSFFQDDTSLWYRSMKFGTDTLQGLLFRKKARATQNSKMAPPKSKMSAQKCVFSFLTQNALILSPINILKFNIKLGIVDILVPSTCLHPLRFLRYSM